jgi:ribosomal protein S14
MTRGGEAALQAFVEGRRTAPKGSQGPVLKSFPLSRAQLRELALKPELLP